MAVVPSTVRGHRRGKFRVDLDNRSREVVDLELAGEGPELAFTLRPDRVALRPGDRVRTSGKVKAPRHLVGEPRQLSFTSRREANRRRATRRRRSTSDR